MAQSKSSRKKQYYEQIVYDRPRKVFKEKYLTKKGKRLLMNKEITKKEAWEKYGKNRYTIDPEAKPIRVITHRRF